VVGCRSPGTSLNLAKDSTILWHLQMDGTARFSGAGPEGGSRLGSPF